MKKHFLFKMVFIVLFFIAGNKTIFPQMRYNNAYIIEYQENQNSEVVLFFICKVGIDDGAGTINVDLYKLPKNESLVDNQEKIEQYLNSNENIYAKINLSDSLESGMSIIFKNVIINGKTIAGTTAQVTLIEKTLTISIGRGKDHIFLKIMPA